VQAQMGNKHDLVLYPDKELVEKTRNLGFNLSKTFKNHLKHVDRSPWADYSSETDSEILSRFQIDR
jgi:post-segregation antitoxin (ccd killing protein)